VQTNPVIIAKTPASRAKRSELVQLSSLEKPTNAITISRIYIEMNGIVKLFTRGGATTSTVTAANTADALSANPRLRRYRCTVATGEPSKNFEAAF